MNDATDGFPFQATQSPVGKHRPWKTLLGLALWLVGGLFTIVNPAALSFPLRSVGAVFIAIGVVHTLARLQLLAVRFSVRARAVRFSPLPPAMVACGALYYVTALALGSISLRWALVCDMIGVALGLGGWRWWMQEITRAIGE